MWQHSEAMLDQFTFTAQTWSRCISQLSVAGETTFHRSIKHAHYSVIVVIRTLGYCNLYRNLVNARLL